MIRQRIETDLKPVDFLSFRACTRWTQSPSYKVSAVMLFLVSERPVSLFRSTRIDYLYAQNRMSTRKDRRVGSGHSCCCERVDQSSHGTTLERVNYITTTWTPCSCTSHLREKLSATQPSLARRLSELVSAHTPVVRDMFEHQLLIPAVNVSVPVTVLLELPTTHFSLLAWKYIPSTVPLAWLKQI